MRRHKAIPRHPRAAMEVYDLRSQEDSAKKTLEIFNNKLVKPWQEPVSRREKHPNPAKEGITLMSPVGKEGLF